MKAEKQEQVDTIMVLSCGRLLEEIHAVYARGFRPESVGFKTACMGFCMGSLVA